MIKRVLKKVTTYGLRMLARNIIFEAKAYWLHLRGLIQSRRYRSKTDLRLNLGCGRKIKNGWVNVDLSRYVDLSLDLREPLPFENNSCAFIYSEHFVEHIDYPFPAMSFFESCYRVLKPGGIISIGVPDTEWLLLSYAGQSDEDYFAYYAKHFHPKWCETKMEHINYHFSQDMHHRFAYDYETLKHVIEKVGFVDVTRRSFNQSLDSEDRKVGTLYVEATKPSS